MLLYANMERLCAKDKLECIILFTLVNIDLENPYQKLNHAVLVSQYTENPEMKNQCRKFLEELVGLKNSDEIRDDVDGYLKKTLETLKLEEIYGE